MKCPKCQYLAFEPEARCRHCGYDFSLASEESSKARADDLPIRADDDPVPFADFSIRTDHPQEPEDLPPAGVSRYARTPTGGTDLPLFSGTDAGTPVVTAPRPPLAVRRATPDPLRLRSRTARHEAEAPVLGFEPPPVPEHQWAPASEAPAELPPTIGDEAPDTSSVENRATPAMRLLGAAIDALLVFGVDAAVVYFTLAASGLALAQVTMLPVAPMVAFFLVLNGGYAAAFTAVNGRTIGKMVAGTTTVRLDGGHVTFGQALLRTGGYVLSALPAGLGFLLGLVGARLALHDRLAGTHVIRA